jgi:glutamate/tyrosine decarboxylase-like PLP-dependent enzyme
MDVRALRDAIAADRLDGFNPFCVVATAGTVNTGAIDDLDHIARVCADEQAWLHVDAAFGGLCMLSDRLRSRLAGIERADSLAFDFHKWAQVQYDAGCILVRDGDKHRAAYSDRPDYLHAAARGLGGGGVWPCEFGPELSRCFRALKIWFALKEHGTRKLGRVIERNCLHAEHLRKRVAAETELELLAPLELNIVCFRFRPPGADEVELDRLNEDIVADLQLSGIAAPSSTRVAGKVAIRVNITNHRTRQADLDALLDGVLSIGRASRVSRC